MTVLVNLVTKVRFHYHAEALDVNNILNQIGVRGNEKAEEIGKKHTMILFNDIIPRMYPELEGLKMTHNNKEGS